MKSLILLRHAKSSWANPSLDDFDRPLNKRGQENAHLIGQSLAAKGECPDIILSSPAKRARKTAHLVALELDLPKTTICLLPDIYEADSKCLLEIVWVFKDIWQSVIMVGHNPGLTDLANNLGSYRLENMVTCGVVKLEFMVSFWKDIEPYSGVVPYYLYPKMISQF